MPSRVDNLQSRKAKAVSKGKDKKAAKLTKKINKSMARQEERGIRKAERQKRRQERKKINDYTKGVKTSGMRKKFKKALGRGAATGAAGALGSGVAGSAAAGMGKKMSK